RGFRRILVEGGAEVLAAFFRAGLVDRATVYLAPVLIGGRSAPPMLAGPESPDAAGALRLRALSSETLGPGVLLTFAPLGLAGAPL
ncbi:MAG: RibD family protein, partial [Thermoplasmata archaeon]